MKKCTGTKKWHIVYHVGDKEKREGNSDLPYDEMLKGVKQVLQACGYAAAVVSCRKEDMPKGKEKEFEAAERSGKVQTCVFRNCKVLT